MNNNLDEILEALTIGRDFIKNSKAFFTGYATNYGGSQDMLDHIEKLKEQYELMNRAITSVRQYKEDNQDELASLREELEDRDASAELRHAADMRAIAAWQQETGEELKWPNHADLCVWLINKINRPEDIPDDVDDIFGLHNQRWVRIDINTLGAIRGILSGDYSPNLMAFLRILAIQAEQELNIPQNIEEKNMNDEVR